MLEEYASEQIIHLAIIKCVVSLLMSFARLIIYVVIVFRTV